MPNGYLVEPLKGQTIYEFDMKALDEAVASNGGRFSEPARRIRNILNSGCYETKAPSLAKAAANVLVNAGASRYELGPLLDDMEMFAARGNHAYAPGFVRETDLRGTGGKRVWVPGFYDARDLGLLRYGNRRADAQKYLASRFEKTHRLRINAEKVPGGIDEVEETLDMIAREQAPSRELLHAALLAVFQRPEVYSDNQILSIFGNAGRQNRKLGTEEAQREYVDKVLAEIPEAEPMVSQPSLFD